MSLFFTYESDLPAGVGFALFGPAHLLWLALLAAVSAVILCAHRRGDAARRRRIENGLALSLPVWILLRTLVLLLIGRLNVGELPLHLCSIAGLLCFCDSRRPRPVIGELLYAACLPGLLGAILFPDGTMYPAICFITVETFCFHTAAVLYVICRLRSGAIRPSLRHLPAAFGLLALLALPVYLFDLAFDTDYFFLRWPTAGSPFVWVQSVTGEKLYPLGVAAFALCAILVMELLAKCAVSVKSRTRT